MDSQQFSGEVTRFLQYVQQLEQRVDELEADIARLTLTEGDVGVLKADIREKHARNRERDFRAAELRMSGMPFREIGERVGRVEDGQPLSTTAAAQLVRRGLRRLASDWHRHHPLHGPAVEFLSSEKSFNEANGGHDGLSLRSTNALRNMFEGRFPPSKAEVAKVKAVDFLGMPNFGRKCLVELEEWLSKDGLKFS